MRNPLLLDPPQEIATERLLLRTPRAGDGPALFEGVSESVDNLRRFLASLPWVAHEPSVESSETFCRNAVANFHARKDFPFFALDRSSGRLLGACGLHRPDWDTPRFELGYWCRTTALGHGYMGEAVKALCQYAFRHFDAARLELFTDEENVASRRVAECSGFLLEGVLRAHRREHTDGSLRNMCVYSRLPADRA